MRRTGNSLQNVDGERENENSVQISFLVPTLGLRLPELKRLLQSLVEQKKHNFEVIIVAQGKYEVVETLCKKYSSQLYVRVISENEKGLSRARNVGLEFCAGEVIVLSDDDCWYPNNAAEDIISQFSDNQCDIILTQIYDYEHCELYKSYRNVKNKICMSIDLLSRSSIEIAFRRKYISLKFDEQFGLGARYACCEEVDFLIRTFRNGARICYIPIVTVYHERKSSSSSSQQIQAKAALYAKNFNILFIFAVCIRDLIKKKQINFRDMIKGYFNYKRLNNDT